MTNMLNIVDSGDEYGARRRLVPVCLIGVFPPARGGQAYVNEQFKRRVSSTGTPTTVIDISPRSSRPALRRLSRIPSVLIGLCLFVSCLASGRAKHVYIGVAGGPGKAYDLLFTALSRAGRARLFFRHDSFAYLNAPSSLAKLLFWLAGRQTTHIVLCESMATSLRDNYRSVGNILVVSNIGSIEFPDARVAHRTRLATVGLISNLTLAKGVHEFFAVTERCHQQGIGIRGLLAGPPHEPGIETIIREQLAQMAWVQYLGAVRGEAKDEFYRDIDVLLFATRHPDEAEPLVILEALAHGVVVIAFGRGCIPSLLRGVGDATIPTTADFVVEAAKYLERWWQSPSEFGVLSESCIRRAAEMMRKSTPKMDEAVAAIVGVQLPTEEGNRGSAL